MIDFQENMLKNSRYMLLLPYLLLYVMFCVTN